MGKSLLTKINGLPNDVQHRSPIAELKRLEIKRANDPAWQARLSRQRSDLRLIELRQALYVLVTIVLMQGFVYLNPLGLSDMAGRFFLDHWSAIVSIAAISVAYTLNDVLNWSDNQSSRRESWFYFFGGLAAVSVLLMSNCIGRAAMSSF